MPDFARSADPRVQAELDRLSLLSPGRDVLGLERIRALLDRLGNPQASMPPAFHVAGTNGKGSTVAILRGALEAAGYRVHAFTSPHLVRFNERIRLAGSLVDDAMLADLLAEVRAASDGISPSFFEATTAAAFLAFARVPAEVCVIEVGLGGRLDATNVLAQVVACGIASLGLDHQAFLGSTLAEIGAEKAGIAKDGVPLVALDNPPEALAAIGRVADAAGAPLRLEGRDWAIDPTLRPALPGAHQLRNANLAWQMLRAQHRFAVGRASFDNALASAQWPARFQRLPEGPIAPVETWLDGAHNADAAQALGALLADRGPMHLVLGILANKDAAGIVEMLRPHALSLTFVPVPDHDHFDPVGLAARYGGRAASGLDDALAPLPAPRLVAGSLYLAGEALARNGNLPT